MGCINSSNHRKKYLQPSSNNLQENLPPENDLLSNKTSLKSRNETIELRKNQKQPTSQQFTYVQYEGTQKLNYEIESKKLRKLSGQGSERFSNKSTERSKKDQKGKNENAMTKKSTRMGQDDEKLEDQEKLNRQEERILQILKRSEKISRVYRKVCAKMMEHNQEIEAVK